MSRTLELSHIHHRLGRPADTGATIDRHVITTTGKFVESYVNDNRYQLVERIMVKIVEARPRNTYHIWQLGVLYAHQGDREAHEQHCQRSFEAFADTEDPRAAGHVTQHYLSLPPLDDSVLLDRAIALARRIKSSPKSDGWGAFSRGLAEYRATNYIEAAEYLAKARMKLDAESKALVTVFFAMAEHQRGRSTDARRLLVEAEELIKPIISREDRDLRQSWGTFLIADLY